MNNSGDDDKNILNGVNNAADPDADSADKIGSSKIGAQDESAMKQYIGEVKELFSSFKKKDTDVNESDNIENSDESGAYEQTKATNIKPSITVADLLKKEKPDKIAEKKTQKTVRASLKNALVPKQSQTVPEDGRTNILYARRTLRIWLISLFVVILVVQLTFSTVNYLFFAPPSNNSAKVEFVVPKSPTISTVAKLLQEQGFIKNETVFKLYAQFTNSAYKLKAGVYELSKNMGISEVLETITRGEGETSVVKLVILEGKTANDMANQIKSGGFIDNTKTYLELIDNSTQYIEKYPFLAGITNASSRKHFLEGYLFPDTYEVYSDATADQIIQKQLTRLKAIYTDEYAARATALGMTMDQVITLASIIEKEVKTADFKKVSAVFHNRLKKGMALQSDATVQYAEGIRRMNLTEEDTAYDSPYNTYLHKGLPVGPICSPGKKAIEAALYPDETYVKQGYLYFCVSDPETGATVFSKTYEEHLANVQKYKPLWQAYDSKNGL